MAAQVEGEGGHVASMAVQGDMGDKDHGGYSRNSGFSGLLHLTDRRLEYLLYGRICDYWHDGNDGGGCIARCSL